MSGGARRGSGLLGGCYVESAPRRGICRGIHGGEWDFCDFSMHGKQKNQAWCGFGEKILKNMKKVIAFGWEVC